MVWAYGVVLKVDKMVCFAKVCSHLCLLSGGSSVKFSSRSNCWDSGRRFMRVGIERPVDVGLGSVLSSWIGMIAGLME